MKKRTPSAPLKPDSMGLDSKALRKSIANHLCYTVGKDFEHIGSHDWFSAIAYAVRDRITERWLQSSQKHAQADAKKVYYLSLEFLIGRSLSNSLLNLGMYEEYRQFVQDSNLDEETLCNLEPEAALGNGGLGRLAACFLDSMASLNLPGHGYGIRYEYGMFNQHIRNGWQTEHPDNWLRYGNVWEFPRPEVLYQVKFGGRVVEYCDEKGRCGSHWADTEEVMAMAFDMPVVGYGNSAVNTLRLWSAKSSRDFDLHYFNAGDYIKAVEHKNLTETLSKVLYPSDVTVSGRELRLRQEYFFVSASLQDIVHAHLNEYGTLENLHTKVAIQLNDTHPALAIPELMHILLDRHHFNWDKAWEITQHTFAYTNHTLLPEALEMWEVSLFEQLLPRHLKIIYEINHRFLKEVAHRYPGDVERLRRMSLIAEEGGKRIRMGYLAFVGSHKVNGVAALHTELMKTTTFKDFHECFPERIINKTNGITPRRWLNEANPNLSQLITQTIGQGWLTDLSQLKQLIPLAENESFRTAFKQVKQHNKERLSNFIFLKTGIRVNPYSLFDVQIKRMHEYKRQLLNLLHVITHYNYLRQNPNAECVPRTVIFAGKSAPAYFMAKLIIKLINDVADVINHDPNVGDRLKVVFIPNYDVSTASHIIPAADLSEQISTAGTEASGTGNMKLALNGALTIGTLDGANVEIREEVGAENFFIFGLTTTEVFELRNKGYNPWDYYYSNPELRQVLDMINSGYFSPDEPNRFKPIFNTLTQDGDRYLLLADYADYIACQRRVDDLYRQSDAWTRQAILNTANMGKFSSDRTIAEYATEIWGIGAIL